MSECNCNCSEKLDELESKIIEKIQTNQKRIDYLEFGSDDFGDSRTKLFFDDLPTGWPFIKECILEASENRIVFEAEDLDMLLEFQKKIGEYQAYHDSHVEESGDCYKFIVEK